MSDLKQSHGVLWGRLAWHPAVKAWLAFAEGAGEPDTIEVLRDGKESAAHRLPAPGGARGGGRAGGGGGGGGGGRRPAVATKQQSRALEPRPVDERLTPAIRRTLEAGLTRLRGRPLRIQEIRRPFSRGSSSFPTERLRVSLKGERRPLLVFFKDLHPN